MSNTKSFADNPPPILYATAVEVHAVPIEAIQAQPAIAEHYIPPSNGGHQGIPMMAEGGGYQQHHGSSLSQGQGYGHPQGPDYSNPQGYSNPYQQDQGYAHQQSMNGYQQQFGNDYHQQQPANSYHPQQGIGNQWQHPNDIGICRRCNRHFRRQPGVHDSSANFYRCEECSGLKLQDVVNSCRIV